MQKKDDPRRKQNQPDEKNKTKKQKSAWLKPEVTVIKVDTPPAWSSCSFGSNSAENK